MKIQHTKNTLGFVLVMAGSLYGVKLYHQTSYAMSEVVASPINSSIVSSVVKKREIKRITSNLKQFKLNGYKKWETRRQGILIQRKRLEFMKRNFVPLSVYV